jgi:hypothetical protein
MSSKELRKKKPYLRLVSINRWIIKKNGLERKVVVLNKADETKHRNFAIMSVINSFKALIFFSTIIICGSFGFFFAVTPAIPFILLNRRIYFRWCSSVMGYFLLMVTVNNSFYFLFEIKIDFISVSFRRFIWNKNCCDW